MRVERLETWAGPGQAEAFAAGLRAVRAELAVVRRVQDQHTALLNGLRADFNGLKAEIKSLRTDVDVLKTDMAEVKADVAELKAGMAEVKAGMREILRRLPPLAAAGDNPPARDGR